jgi:hypothetical protein
MNEVKNYLLINKNTSDNIYSDDISKIHNFGAATTANCFFDKNKPNFELGKTTS